MTANARGNYLEDFSVGQVFRHHRGRTLTEYDNVRWSLSTMNTAQGHWNREHMRSYFGGAFDEPIINGTVVLATTVGLSSEDMSEHSLGDLRIDRISIRVPVFAGDTLRAVSRVLRVEDHPARKDCGALVYRICSSNQRGEDVCALERTVLLKRRSAWATRDEEYAHSIFGEDG